MKYLAHHWVHLVGRALKNVPVSEGVKNAHSTISGEIGGKAGEAMYQCIQNPKQAGC